MSKEKTLKQIEIEIRQLLELKNNYVWDSIYPGYVAKNLITILDIDQKENANLKKLLKDMFRFNEEKYTDADYCSGWENRMHNRGDRKDCEDCCIYNEIKKIVEGK